MGFLQFFFFFYPQTAKTVLTKMIIAKFTPVFKLLLNIDYETERDLKDEI